MKKVFFGTIASIFFHTSAFAATISCNFTSETTISKSGVWVKTDSDSTRLYRMFGDGPKLPLDDSLLENLDSGKSFFAGSVTEGDIYLMGGDIGIEGKLTSVKDENISIFDGFCDVIFG